MFETTKLFNVLGSLDVITLDEWRELILLSRVVQLREIIPLYPSNVITALRAVGNPLTTFERYLFYP